jgi:hypothetical protein
MLKSPDGLLDAGLLQQYRNATEALLDAISVFESRFRTRNGAEYDRLEKLVEKRQIELVEVRAQYERREFERPDDLKRSG